MFNIQKSLVLLAAAALLPTVMCSAAGAHGLTTPHTSPWKIVPPQHFTYLSDSVTKKVYVYHTQNFAPAGILNGLTLPVGLCEDRSTGDIYVTNQGQGNWNTVVGYHRGHVNSFVILQDYNENPTGCSLDPATGTLAVANLAASDGTAGSVSVYHNANGVPTKVSSPNFQQIRFLGYGPNSTLWMDGYNPGGSFQYGSMLYTPPTYAIAPVTLVANIHTPSNVQWDGTYMTVGDQSTATIFRVFPNGGTAGTTQLGNTTGVMQYDIRASTVIAPDPFITKGWNFFSYPGGVLQFTISGGFSDPMGAAMN